MSPRGIPTTTRTSPRASLTKPPALISSTSSATRTIPPPTSSAPPGKSAGDGWRPGCDRVRLRQLGNDERPVAVLRAALAENRTDPRRSGRLAPGRVHQRRHVEREIRALDGGRHRRGFPAGDLRFLAGEAGVRGHRQGKLPHGARTTGKGGDPRRLDRKSTRLN